MAITGIITNIQRFSLHDGPGIRTTVFMKGCPLRCLWCHNPETYDHRQELCYRKEKCIGCGLCLLECSRQALRKGEDGLEYREEDCSRCFQCANQCPSHALFVCGTKKTPEETLRELLEDRELYENSGGGVTFSGGEATMQSAFVTELARCLKAEGISSALDTCGYCEPRRFCRTTELMDLCLFDLKHSDSQKHKELTGVGNRRILSNLFSLEEMGKRIHIRIPVIPGMNDDRENFKSLAGLLEGLHQVEEVVFLGYHGLGLSKVFRFNSRQKDWGIKTPDRAKLENLREYFQKKLPGKRVIVR